MVADGYEPLAVASRFGPLHLRRQICVHPQTKSHLMPGNALLPTHQGMLITRGLMEWSCLLPQELPFASVARLLGWQTGEPGVAAAVGRAQPRPPEGVSWADWERVLAARRAEAGLDLVALRRLGPEHVPGQLLLTLDEVLSPAREPGHFHELRTACLATAEGRRYLSGTGDAFLNQVLAGVLGCFERSLLVIADGARWIRAFCRDCPAGLPQTTMLLDRHHLEHKCRDLASRFCSGRVAKARLLRRLYRRLWRGEGDRALRVLALYRPQARNQEALEGLRTYLATRAEWIPNYRARRRSREYIGSGQVEKANDRIVARRQKCRGMPWGARTSDALAALRTLLLNVGWEEYWVQREALPLIIAA